jgi:hypothetical protein
MRAASAVLGLAFLSSSVAVASADLTLSVDPVYAFTDYNDLNEFVFTVTNAGPGDATGLVLTVSLGQGLIFLDPFPQQDWSCTGYASAVACRLPTLAAGATATGGIIALTYPPVDDLMMSDFLVTANEDDPDQRSNEVTVWTVFIGRLFRDGFDPPASP